MSTSKDAVALSCGFFREMRNYYSYPKWIYNTSLINFLHVFEMPLLGYIDYIPFAWDLYATYNLIACTVMGDKTDYIICVR